MGFLLKRDVRVISQDTVKLVKETAQWLLLQSDQVVRFAASSERSLSSRRRFVFRPFS